MTRLFLLKEVIDLYRPQNSKTELPSAQTRGRRATAVTFSRQNDAGSQPRPLGAFPWERGWLVHAPALQSIEKRDCKPPFSVYAMLP